MSEHTIDPNALVGALAMQFADAIQRVACYRCHKSYEETEEDEFCVRSRTTVDKHGNLTEFSVSYVCKGCGIMDAAENAAEYRGPDDAELEEARDILDEMRGE